MNKGRKLAITLAVNLGLIGLCVSFVYFFMGLITGNLLEAKTIRNIVFYPVTGVLIGLVAAPAAEPESFKSPLFWQISFAILGGLFFAYIAQASFLGYFLSVIISGFLGCTVKYWFEYLSFP